ncbi:MAG: DUF4440 domain-containing protein [Acidobacteria bacterium]|nr:DUF4440 domain-containing protein [Acidobacteriota bacterium]
MPSKITNFAIPCLLALVAASALATNVAAQKENKAIAEVRELDKQLSAAFHAKEPDKQLAQYWNSPDLFTVGEGGQITKGWDAAKKFAQQFYASTDAINLSLPDCQYWATGDGVVTGCAHKMSFKLKNGPAVETTGWYNNLRKKIGGKWLIVYEAVSQNVAPPPGPVESLYKRLGGYDALAAVSDDFLGRLAADQRLGQFFKGVSKPHLGRIRQHVVDFLCMATGGPCIYAGADMKSTHAGLGIGSSDWDRMAGFLVQTFDKFSVPPRERQEVLGALSGLKGDIVEKP